MEISNLLSQALEDTQRSILLCSLEPSCPSTASPKGIQPRPELHLPELPLCEGVPSTTSLHCSFSEDLLESPVPVVTSRGGHIAEAQMPRPTPPYPLPATWPGLGLAPATLWLQEATGKAFATQASAGPALGRACSWHSCGLMGQDEEQVS